MRICEIKADSLDDSELNIDYLKYASNINHLNAIVLYRYVKEVENDNIRSLVAVILRQIYLNNLQDLGALVRSLHHRYCKISSVRKYNKQRGVRKKKYPSFLPLIAELSSIDNDTIPRVLYEQTHINDFLKQLGLSRATYDSQLNKIGTDKKYVIDRAKSMQEILKGLKEHLNHGRDFLNKVKHGKSIVSSNILVDKESKHYGSVVIFKAQNGKIYVDLNYDTIDWCEQLFKLIFGVTMIIKDVMLYYEVVHHPGQLKKAIDDGSLFEVGNILEQMMVDADVAPEWMGKE